MTTNHATAGAETQSDFIAHGTWKVVPEGSTVAFRVKKMGLYYVKGRFRDFEGHIEFAPGSSSPSGELTLEAESIGTRMPPRDWHLRTNDFLGVRRNPRIRVSVPRVDTEADGELEVPATVEIRGQTAQVDLALHAHRLPGEAEAATDRARLHVQGVLDRHRFGIKPMPPAEWVVASDVHVDADLLLERVG